MKILCEGEGCGVQIDIGWQYYHNQNEDTNYCLTCGDRMFEEPERTMEIRLREE